MEILRCLWRSPGIPVEEMVCMQAGQQPAICLSYRYWPDIERDSAGKMRVPGQLEFTNIAGMMTVVFDKQFTCMLIVLMSGELVCVKYFDGMHPAHHCQKQRCDQLFFIYRFAGHQNKDR